LLTVSSPHDALFKYVFSQPEHAASELRAVLPAALSARLDWGSLELQRASFVDERLSGREADVLFTVRCEGRSTLLYVLFEHQSTNDPLMAFRLLRYLVRIWESVLIEQPDRQRLPAIIPVVVHHGSSGWTEATELCSLIDLDAETLSLLGMYVPQFRFVLDDLSRADEAELRGRSLTALAAAGLMLLSRGRSAPDLLAELRRWSDVFGHVAQASSGVEALSALLEYAFRVGEVLPEDLRKLALQLGPAAEEAYMTAAQRLTAEAEARAETRGEVLGRAKGKAELLLRQLGVRFGVLSEEVREQVLHAPPERLDVWAERVITAQSLEEVLSCLSQAP
jgi:predicted transposase/invertase (TIGR01784 family)